MAVTTSVLSGTITDVIGDLNTNLLSRVVLAIEANTDGSLLLDTSGDRLMAGAKRITVDPSTGAYTVTLVKTDSADVIPSGGRLYRAFLQYPSGIPGAGNVKKYSGWFELTADGSLSDADKWPGLEVTSVTQALVDSIGDQYDAIMGVVATTEGLMTSVLGSGGTFDSELSATFVGKGVQSTIQPLPATATDVYGIQFKREATYTGGTPGWVNSAIRVQHDVSADVATYEWGITSVLNNSATAGENVAIYGQSNKDTSTAGPTWAGVFEFRDKSGVADPTSASVGIEVDVYAIGTDANSNRYGIDVVCSTGGEVGANPEAAAGIRISGTGNGKFISGLLVANNTTYGVQITGTSTNAIRVTGTSSGAALALNGTCVVGVNLSSGTQTGSAIRLARGQKVAWENTDTIAQSLDATVNIHKFTVSGTEKIGLDVDNSQVRINTTTVLTARKTGWATATGTATRTTFDTTTVTVTQLAERVKALIDDLHATAGHGLIGA